MKQEIKDKVKGKYKGTDYTISTYKDGTIHLYIPGGQKNDAGGEWSLSVDSVADGHAEAKQKIDKYGKKDAKSESRAAKLLSVLNPVDENQEKVDDLEAQVAELGKEVEAAEKDGDSEKASELKLEIKKLNDEMSALKSKKD